MLTFMKRYPKFSKLTGLNLFSRIGDRLFYTAMLTMAASLPQATSAVTVVSISETVPLLLGFVLGGVDDTHAHKIRDIIINLMVRVTLFLAIGSLLNFKLSFLLMLTIATLNFLADLFGNYSSALAAPFTKVMVKAEDMEEAQGLISISTQLVNVMAVFGGSVLLTFCGYQFIALINALIFLGVGLVFLISKKGFSSSESLIPTHGHAPLGEMVRENFKALFTDKLLRNDLLQLALINGFFGGLTPLFVLFLKQSNVVVVSKPITISILSCLITVFMVVGNELSRKVFRQSSTTALNTWANVLIILTGIGFLITSLPTILFSCAGLAFLLGIVSPRFSAKIINQYPVERLGGIVTTVNSLLVVTPPLAAFLFPILVVVNLLFAYVCIMAYGLALLCMTCLVVHGNHSLKIKDKAKI